MFKVVDVMKVNIATSGLFMIRGLVLIEVDIEMLRICIDL